MLTDLIEFGQKIKKQVKDTQSEIKQNVQGTKVTGRKPGLKATIWKKENINIHQNEETRIWKSEETLTNLWDNLKWKVPVSKL